MERDGDQWFPGGSDGKESACNVGTLKPGIDFSSLAMKVLDGT